MEQKFSENKNSIFFFFSVKIPRSINGNLGIMYLNPDFEGELVLIAIQDVKTNNLATESEKMLVTLKSVNMTEGTAIRKR